MSIVTLHTGRRVATGLVRSSRAALSAAWNPFGHGSRVKALPAAPATIINSAGVVLDPYGNSDIPDPRDTSYPGDPVGNCTCAAIATILVALSQVTGLAGGQLNLLASMVVQWWQTNNPQCDILHALEMLQTVPMVDAKGNPYTIGASGVIDWSNYEVVQQSLNLFKAIDNGLDSSPLQAAVGNSDGFIVAGVTKPLSNYDHSTPTLDVGEAGAIADAWKVALDTNKINATEPVIGMATWGVKGIVEFESYVNMNGEAHVILTSTARGDSAAWNPVAESDFTDLTGEPPSADEPTPAQKLPTQRAIEVARRAARHYRRDPAHVLQVLERLESAFPE
jgi:hypothetical protein